MQASAFLSLGMHLCSCFGFSSQPHPQLSENWTSPGTHMNCILLHSSGFLLVYFLYGWSQFAGQGGKVHSGVCRVMVVPSGQISASSVQAIGCCVQEARNNTMARIIGVFIVSWVEGNYYIFFYDFRGYGFE